MHIFHFMPLSLSIECIQYTLPVPSHFMILFWYCCSSFRHTFSGPYGNKSLFMPLYRATEQFISNTLHLFLYFEQKSVHKIYHKWFVVISGSHNMLLSININKHISTDLDQPVARKLDDDAAFLWPPFKFWLLCYYKHQFRKWNGSNF